MITLVPNTGHRNSETIPGTVAEHSGIATVPGLWVRHKLGSRPLGQIMADARAGKLPGAFLSADGAVVVEDPTAVVAAMKTRGA